MTRLLSVFIVVLIISVSSHAIYLGLEPLQGDPSETSTVALMDEDGNLICSGSLLSPHLVLTAAHCVEIKNKPIIYFTRPGENIDKPRSFSTTNMRMPKRIFRTERRQKEMPSSIYLKQNHVPTAGNDDLALIEISGVPPLRNDLTAEQQFGFTKIMTLQDSDWQVDATTVYAAGFGTDESGIAGRLKVASLAFDGVIDNAKRTTFVSLAKQNGQICMGDSGGPIFSQMNDQWFIVGISSHRLIDTENDSEARNLYKAGAPAYMYCGLKISYAVDLGHYTQFLTNVVKQVN